MMVESLESSTLSKHPRVQNAIALLPQEQTPQTPQESIPTQTFHASCTRNVPSTAQPQSPHTSIQGQLEDLRYLVHSLLQEHVESKKPLTSDMRLRLRNVQTSMQREPGSVATRLLDDLNASDAANANLLSQFRAMVSSRQPGIDPTFPPIPNQRQVDQDWQAVREGIKAAFTDKRSLSIEGPEPTAVSAGYIASTIDNLLEDPRTRKSLYAQLAAHLKSPHIAHSLMGALFCRWLFAIPDEMCEGKHSELTMKQYETTLLSGT